METLEQERTRSGASNGKLTVLNPEGFPPRISPNDMAPCDDPDATGPSSHRQHPRRQPPHHGLTSMST